MIIGTISVEHSVTCRSCGAEVRGGTSRRMYARLAFHVWRRHDLTTLQLLGAWIALALGRRA